MNWFKKVALAGVLSFSTFISPINGCATPIPHNNPMKTMADTTKTNTPSLDEILENHNVKSAKVLIRNSERDIYGSGCVYHKADGFFYIVTNHHVVEPKDEGNPKDNKQLTIVDSSDDTFTEDDVQLEVIVSSPRLDVAVMRAKETDVAKSNTLHDEYNKLAQKKKSRIEVFKGEIGDSSAVKEQDTIIVAGYPLTIPAITRGYASNTGIQDTSGNWDHECFVIQTPISPGNSGSGTYWLKDGKLYLIGVVHAHFVKGENMNLAIKINEFKDMLSSFKNPDDVSEADFARVTSYAKTGSVLDRLFIIAVSSVLVDSSDTELKYVLYQDDFPTDLLTSIELVDKIENGLGKVDAITIKKKESSAVIETSNVPESLQQAVQEFYEKLTKTIAVYADYKMLVNKPGKQSLFEHEQMKRLSSKLEILEEECALKAANFEAKMKECEPSLPKGKLY